MTKKQFLVAMESSVIHPTLNPSTRDNTISNLAVGSGVSLMGKIVGRGSYILGQIILARLYGPEVFGLFAIGLTIILLMDRFTPLGLDKGIIRFGAIYRNIDKGSFRGVILKSLWVSMFCGLIIGSGIYLATPWFVKIYGDKEGLQKILQGFAIGLPFMVGLRMAASATRISQRMKFAAITQDIGQPLIGLIFILVFYFLGWGIVGAVYAYVISYLVTFVGALFFTSQIFPEIFVPQPLDGPGYRELLNFSLPTAFTGMLGALNLWAARLLIGYFLPESEVGIYQALSQISILFAIILEAFNAIFAPMIAHLFHTNKLVQLEEAFRVSTKWGLYISMPLFLMILAAPQQLLSVMFGELYIKGTVPLTILTIAQFINVGTGAVGFLLIMTGRQNKWLIISAGAVFLNLVLGILLIPQYGINGAAVADSFSTIFLFLMGLYQTKHLLRLWPYDRRFLKGILALMIPVFLLFFFPRDQFGNLVELFFIGLIAHLGFAAGLLALGLDQEDKAFIQTVLAKARVKMPTAQA